MMMKATASQILIDEEDRALFASRSWHNNGRNYFKARFGGVNHYLHRLIMGAGPGQAVDHIDGDPLNCRRANMRLCTQGQNNRNRAGKRDRTSRYKGVSLARDGRWVAQIMVAGRYYFLGRHVTEEAAAEAYRVKADELHGAFARTSG